MKPYCWLIALFIAVSCKPKSVPVKTNTAAKPVRVLPAGYKMVTAIKAAEADTSETDEQLNAYASYYVLVVDTGKSYEELRNKMFNLHQSSNLDIDTLGRYYDKTKGLIQLPDGDDDEMYAGEYYPRRYPSQYLSLEYLDEYHPGSESKMIALVAGIYETKTSADSILEAIQPSEKAFVLKARIYVGCMH
ncbi:hypothetical protein [Mucilaginibacter ginsenosidivorax]|uniref:Uncharacterized protein n=1 Tax=Mucilaginibacter ginsenosidivorax TaxID=862126 RepID=A0A5B8VXB6_9SPHI|nr:hypothetical protein [Mucilaginibacter ginsenosidivorax]QEC75851.1 hypothetical protein FSB76_07780 [Mucilaginibacter ginsenosidivorax]